MREVHGDVKDAMLRFWLEHGGIPERLKLSGVLGLIMPFTVQAINAEKS